MKLRLHDLTIEVQGADAAAIPLRDLLGRLPAAGDRDEPDMVVRLHEAPPQPRPEGVPRFFHGPVEVHAADEDLVVTDGASRALVRREGREVVVDVAVVSLREGHVFAHVFLFVALVLALRWRGLYHVHAGALVGPDGSGFLVVGSAGAGKSTTTLALAELGCAYLGDDAVFLRSQGGRDEVLALPRPFHVAPRTAAAFPRIAGLRGELLPAGEKRRLDPRAAWPDGDRASMPFPSIILLPHVAGDPETTIALVGTAEALGALVESSTYVVVDGLPGRLEHLDLLRRIADGACTLRVTLGRDLLERPAEVGRRLLEASSRLGRGR